MRKESKKHNKKATEEGENGLQLNCGFLVQNLLRTIANLVHFTEYHSGKAQLPLFPSSGSTQGILGNSQFSCAPFNQNECNCWVFF